MRPDGTLEVFDIPIVGIRCGVCKGPVHAYELLLEGGGTGIMPRCPDPNCPAGPTLIRDLKDVGGSDGEPCPHRP